MYTKKKLNCYIFSNLIVSFLSLNLLFNNEIITLTNIENNTDSTLGLIKGLKVKEVVVNVPSAKTTISVTKKEVQSKNEITYIKPSYNSVTGSSLVNYAKHYLGLRYISGGYSLTTGTDCSGFTKLIYNEFGINLGRTVKSQIYNGTYVSKSDLKPGDLVFYGNNSNYASHVAIYMGSNLVIHESNPSDGVKISPLNMMTYITSRRVITANVPNIDKKPVEETKQEEVKEELNSNEDTNITNENNEISTDKKEENDNLKSEENITTDDSQINKDDNTNLDIEKSEDDSSKKEEIMNETNNTNTSDNNLESDIIKEEDNNLDTSSKLE